MWLLIGFIAAVFYIYKWLIKKYDFFEKQGIKFVKPLPLIGTNVWMLGRENIAIQIKKFYDQFPNEKVFGLFGFRDPFYCIRDPSLIKHLAVKEFDHFPNHMKGITSDYDEVFGSMLTALRDKKWKEMRSALSPVFTGSKMRMMFDLISEVGHEMGEYFWNEYSNDGPISYDIKNVFSRFTIDVIATCAFGVRVDSFTDPSNEFYEIASKFSRLGASPKQMLKFLFIQQFPKLARMSGVALMSPDSQRVFYKMIIQNMEKREKEKIDRPDMINLLMKIRKGELNHGDAQEDKSNDSIAAVNEELQGVNNATGKKVWSDNEIIAQCLLFFLAGFETTSGTLRFMAYELALNPEIQDRLVSEIDELHESLQGERLTYEKLQLLKYLDQVVSETLRKWPAAFVTDRTSSKDFEYKGEDGLRLKFEKEMVFWIPIFALHRDPKHFPNPDKFDPDRFSEENRRNLNLDAYVPFGVGPRNCIGSRFALLEIKVAIYHLLLKFTFDVAPDTPIPIKFKKPGNGLQPEGDINLYLKPRHKE